METGALERGALSSGLLGNFLSGMETRRRALPAALRPRALETSLVEWKLLQTEA